MKRRKQRPPRHRWEKFVSRYVNRVVRRGYKVALQQGKDGP